MKYLPIDDDIDELYERISILTQQNITVWQFDREKELIDLRVRLGCLLHQSYNETPSPPKIVEDLFEDVTDLPEVEMKALTVEKIASGLHHHGALILRGLFSQENQEELKAGLAKQEEYQYEKIGDAQGCSPFLVGKLLDVYGKTGFLDIMRQYHNNRLVVSNMRTLVQKRVPVRNGMLGLPWHQDVNFFTEQVYGINCWAGITSCGFNNRTLRLIPKRVNQRIGWHSPESAPLNYGNDIPKEEIDKLAGSAGIQKPKLNPGDALLFDEMTMHASAYGEQETEDQIIAVCWFFDAARFPFQSGVPLAI